MPYLPTMSRFQHEDGPIKEILHRIASLQLGKGVPSYEIYDKQTNDYYECDLIVVTGFGVFVVELKHWTGKIHISPISWTVNATQHRPDPHKNNRFKAKLLRGFYRRFFPTLPDVWFESVVVLTHPDADVIDSTPAKTDQHNPTFSSIDRFLDYLRYRKTQVPLPHLSADQVRDVTAKFENLRVKEHVKGYNFPDHEVVQRLTEREDLVELIVRPKEGRRRNLQRFRIFYPPQNSSVDEKQRFLRRANNTLDALEKAGEHPNLLRVWSVPNEYGHVIEGSDWSEEGTLASMIEQSRETGVPWEQARTLITGILQGLAIVHEQVVVHRAIKPENILIAGRVPKIMNFDLAYHLEDNHVTVIADPSELKLDPYTAPEVYQKKGPSEATDLFSVGVILFEMLTGQKPFKCSTDLAAAGGRLTSSKLAAVPEDPPVARQLIDYLVRTSAHERLQRAEKLLELLTPQQPHEEEPKEVNRQLMPGETYDLYRIEELIEKGGNSQIYSAIHGHQQERVAIKMFDTDVAQDRAWAELRAAQSVDSPYMVRIEGLNHWHEERLFLTMNLVKGPSMRMEIKTEKRPSVERFVEVAQCLLQALQQLHERKVDTKPEPLLHNDIKPDNILFPSERHPVLIDFGVASKPGVFTYVGTEGYVAPDLRNGADLEFCENGDLFALGATLFEWLCGCKPYEDLIVGAVCRDLGSLRGDVPVPLQSWLLRAVQTSRTDRFESARRMADILRDAWIEASSPPPSQPAVVVLAPVSIEEQLPAVVSSSEPDALNPFVSYLNSLQNTTGSNENALAESQAMNPFFGFIHVPSKVTEFAHQILTSGIRRHLILTGHAGDGKSTIGLELFKKLKGLPMDTPLRQPLRAVEEIDLLGQSRIIMIKDMSELGRKERLELLQRACSKGNERFFIISNTGTLLETFRAMTTDVGEWSERESHILDALSKIPPAPMEVDEGSFEIVNIVQLSNLDTALEIFKRMVAEKPWAVCHKQECRVACPLYRNASLLRTNFPLIRERVALVFRRLFEYGDRLTLRQITAQLAYAITSGLSCHEAAQQTVGPIPRPVTEFLFFNRFFGEGADGLDDRSLQLKGIRVLRALGAGRQLVPSLERKLWMRNEDESLPNVPVDLEPILTSLRKTGKGFSTSDKPLPSHARTQVRRLLFFFGDFATHNAAQEYCATFLNSRMLPVFSHWQASPGEVSRIEIDQYLKNVLHVLQEHFAGLHLPEEVISLDENLYITLNRRGREIRQSAQVVLARLNRNDFKLQLVKSGWSEVSARYDLVLEEKQSKATLTLELPFLDFVIQRHRGDIANAIQTGYLDRLERFKAQLFSSRSATSEQEMMLVRLQTNQRFATQTFALNNGVLEVL